MGGVVGNGRNWARQRVSLKEMSTKLTANVKAGGCASKLSPKILDQALRGIPRISNRNVLVGYETADDAGVYNLSDVAGKPLAIVQTVDFFTPIVDDPFTFGGIAAANALSDVYAMGGTPISALSLVVFPSKGDIADLQAILQGGAAKIHEAGCAILGGHSISEEEVKFGYAVTGLIDPERIWTNAGARPGDVLLFSKRLGTGVISSALKAGAADEQHVAASIAQMLTLNRDLAHAMSSLDVHACTDVTGFGLMGHAREMAMASNVTLKISLSALRYLPGAEGYSQENFHSGGLKNNRDFVESCVDIQAELDPAREALLYDPQTSGGLLVAVSEVTAKQLMSARTELYKIGQVKERSMKPIEVGE